MTHEHHLPEVRKGQGTEQLEFDDFKNRFLARFYDPTFKDTEHAVEELLAIAWSNYRQARKSAVTRKAGAEFADPEYELSVEWLATRQAIMDAQQRHDDSSKASRILLICGAARNDKSCPGEMSKIFRMIEIANSVLTAAGFEVDVLDLSALTSEYGKVIYPCKGCAWPSMPLCHWPCSCYPNHSLGQVTDG